MAIRSTLSVLGEVFSGFLDSRPFQLAGALSYFTLLSIAPLLLVLTGLTGLLLEEMTIRDALIEEAGDLVGPEGASLLRTISENVGTQRTNIASMITGGLLTLLGATTVFAQLQDALNRVWRVEGDPANALVGFLRTRLVSLGIVLGLGFLLLVSLVLSAAISGVSAYMNSLSDGVEMLWRGISALVSLGAIALVLALLFRFVPDAQVRWSDAAIGALITALLFTLGKFAIGLYLGQAGIGSAYGAAGSAVVFMVWVYYASLILFLGAVVTRVVARRRGRPLVPSPHARAIPA